jgi:hypothetical protein
MKLHQEGLNFVFGKSSFLGKKALAKDCIPKE